LPGRVQIIARHPAFVETFSSPVALDPGAEATLEIVLRRGGSLEGRVIEVDRRSVPGARVELTAADGSVERITYTADDGTFAFAAAPADAIIAVARAEEPDVLVEKLAITVTPDERRVIDLLLPE